MEIKTPFDDDDRKVSAGEEAHQLAAYVKGFSHNWGIHFTPSEEEALAKVIGRVLVSYPWMYDSPLVKMMLGKK